jgi:hypothetical protein
VFCGADADTLVVKMSEPVTTKTLLHFGVPPAEAEQVEWRIVTQNVNVVSITIEYEVDGEPAFIGPVKMMKVEK